MDSSAQVAAWLLSAETFNGMLFHAAAASCAATCTCSFSKQQPLVCNHELGMMRLLLQQTQAIKLSQLSSSFVNASPPAGS